MQDNIGLIWMIIGVALFFIEALLINSVFFIFISISIFLTGALVTLGILSQHSIEMQLLFCLACSAISIITLYKPMRRYFSRNISQYNDIIGQFAVITDKNISSNSTGKAIWSGTIINVEYQNGIDTLEVGEKVEIIAVEGNRFFVKKIIGK